MTIKETNTKPKHDKSNYKKKKCNKTKKKTNKIFLNCKNRNKIIIR